MGSNHNNHTYRSPWPAMMGFPTGFKSALRPQWHMGFRAATAPTLGFQSHGEMVIQKAINWEVYPLVNLVNVQKTMERSTMLLMGKSTISMAMFNSKLLVYQRVHDLTSHKRSLPKLAFVFGGIYNDLYPLKWLSSLAKWGFPISPRDGFPEGEIQPRRAADAVRCEALVFGNLTDGCHWIGSLRKIYSENIGTQCFFCFQVPLW